MRADPLTIGSTATTSRSEERRFVASAPRGTWRLPESLGVRGVIIVLGLIAMILFFRKPEALLLPQLIADDALLFRDAWADGLGSLFHPYAGYTLVAPRLVAWLGVVSVPVAAIPTFYVVASLASMLFTCARIMSPRITIPYGWLAALVIPLVPHDGEVYLNLCYIQWSLILCAFGLLAKRPAVSEGEWLGDSLTLGLVGLSGPFILPAVPFFLIAAVREPRSRYRIVMAAIAVLTTLVQIASLLGTGTLSEHDASATVVRDGMMAVGTKVLAVTFLGRQIPYDLPPLATAVIGGVLGVAVIIALAGRASRGRRTFVIALVSGVAFYALSSVVRVKENPLNLVPFDHGDRYFYIPRILLLWALLLALAGRWRRVAGGLLVLAALSAATTFRTDRPRHYDWSVWAQTIERGRTTTIRVSPYDWTVEIPGRTR
jgi:hypothetical protein